MTVLLSDLADMSPEQRKAVLADIVRKATQPTPAERLEQDKRLRDRIASYEQQYGMTSQELLDRMRRGQLQETHDICCWLMLLKIADP